MSFTIKDEQGNPVTRNGKNLLGLDSLMELRDLSVERRSFTITVSTSDVDRFGDVVVQEKLDTENFDKNPVILWSHQMQNLPIGRCEQHWTEKDGSVTKTRMRIKMADHEFAAQVFDLVRDGFLKSASIGFLPRETEEIPQDKDRKHELFHTPTKFLESELIETSLCNVPANASCLTAMKSMVENGRLPAYAINGLDLPDDDVDRELEELVSEWRLDKALKALDDVEDKDLDLDEEDLGDVSRAELEALIKVAVRSALGRLD